MKFEDYGGALNVEKMVGEWLKENVRPTKTYRSFYGIAYFLKHLFEKDAGIYLTSGEFAALMFLYGYEGNPRTYNDDPLFVDYQFKATLTPKRRWIYDHPRY